MSRGTPRLRGPLLVAAADSAAAAADTVAVVAAGVQVPCASLSIALPAPYIKPAVAGGA